MKHVSDLRERIVKALQGYKVKLDVAIKGISGVEHKFDIIIETEKMRIPIDVLPKDAVLNEFRLIGIYTKLLDTNLKNCIIVADKVSEVGLNLAKEWNMLILKAEEVPIKIKELIKGNSFASIC